MKKSAYAIQKTSGPDSLGRYHYFLYWYDPHPSYCGVCGADPSRGCGHYQGHTRGQAFFGKLPIKEV